MVAAKLVSREPCWGALLRGIDVSVCGHKRHVNRRHFTAKFCNACKHSMAVPATRVRVLTDEMAYKLENRRSTGVWTEASPAMGRFKYRIVNNTTDCFGDRLIVFEATPPRKLEFPHVDSYLVDDEGVVHLCVCKGTAVPLKYVRLHLRKRVRHQEAPDLGSETPTLCEVVVPSSIVRLADAPLLVDFGEELEQLDQKADKEDQDEEEEEPSQPLRKSPEEIRKHRNRQSAEKSRVQKREYIAYLQTRVCELSAMAQALTVENYFWKSLDLVNGDATCPLVACNGFLVAN